jgi:amidase
MASYEISEKKFFHYWDEKNEPVLRIKPNDTVTFETRDCICNVLTEQKNEKYDTAVFDKVNVNPVTGPVYIESAMPGDVLEVHIDKIQLKDRAVVTCQENLGLLGDFFKETTYKITPIRDGFVIFDKRLKIPLDPMIGVLGVTSKGEHINTNDMGSWGGNMDNTMMREGCTLYLPISVEGALAGTGDVHAVMGDGEMNSSALEAPAFVTLTFNVRKDLKITNPAISTPTHFATVATAANSDDAMRESTRDMAHHLKERTSLDLEEISMLMTAVGNNEVCVVCGINARTMRFTMPWYALHTYGFKF